MLSAALADGPSRDCAPNRSGHYPASVRYRTDEIYKFCRVRRSFPVCAIGAVGGSGNGYRRCCSSGFGSCACGSRNSCPSPRSPTPPAPRGTAATRRGHLGRHDARTERLTRTDTAFRRGRAENAVLGRYIEWEKIYPNCSELQ